MGHGEPAPPLSYVLHLLPPALQPWVDVGVLHATVVVVVLAIVARLATRKLELDAAKAPKLQMAAEWLYDALAGYIERMMGPRGREFVPLLATYFVYILTMNLMGLVPGLMSPTSRLAMTAALGVTAVAFVQYRGFREKGLGYLMHFVGRPLWLAPLNLPIHIIGELARVLSLSMRLFGNLYGDDALIMQFILLGAALTSTIYIPAPVQVPMAALVVFFGFVQALVFMSLTAAYIGGAIAEEH
jgi:F-type H+-transporting ATPase subunit a